MFCPSTRVGSPPARVHFVSPMNERRWLLLLVLALAAAIAVTSYAVIQPGPPYSQPRPGIAKH
jgi:hypothetical protein